MKRIQRVCIVAFCLLPLAVPALGSRVFVDVTGGSGIQPSTMAMGMGGGLAAADFDDDGDIDLFVPNAAGSPDQLYRNLGNGQFEEIAAAAGLASIARSRSALWFDYDGDHRLDLVVAGDCHGLTVGCTGVSTLKLYRQVADAQFEDVTLAAGLLDDRVTDTMMHRGGFSAADINKDGYLDLVTSLWLGEAGVLLNNGNGTFTNISVASASGAIPWDTGSR